MSLGPVVGAPGRSEVHPDSRASASRLRLASTHQTEGSGAMPPMALASTHEFLGLAGVAQPPNTAFLNSLQADAALRIAADHVLNT